LEFKVVFAGLDPDKEFTGRFLQGTPECVAMRVLRLCLKTTVHECISEEQNRFIFVVKIPAVLTQGPKAAVEIHEGKTPVVGPAVHCEVRLSCLLFWKKNAETSD
jgi:hypothetical protein